MTYISQRQRRIFINNNRAGSKLSFNAFRGGGGGGGGGGRGLLIYDIVRMYVSNSPLFSAARYMIYPLFYKKKVYE